MDPKALTVVINRLYKDLVNIDLAIAVLERMAAARPRRGRPPKILALLPVGRNGRSRRHRPGGNPPGSKDRRGA